jgi:predicted oxidoreductase (fatty acid repression mutant protein)
MKNKITKVEKPMLTITLTDGKTKVELWVLDVGQWCQLAEHKSFHFSAEKSASFIYVQKGPSGYNAQEYHISTLAGSGNDGNIWDWLQRLVTKGMESAAKEEAAEKQSLSAVA